jgi:hypothetical protein
MLNRGLNQFPLAVKEFIVIYAVLILIALLLSLWIAWQAHKGVQLQEDEELYPNDVKDIVKRAQGFDRAVQAHTHFIGHVLMLFTVAGLYSLTRMSEKIKLIPIGITAFCVILYSAGRIYASQSLMFYSMIVFSLSILYMVGIIIKDLKT